MKICAVLSSIYEFKNGCFFVRIHVPFLELKEKGHTLSYAILGKMDEEKMLEENDILVFARLYRIDPFKLLYRAKAKGKKVVYEIDDDIWTIPPVNPAQTFFSPLAKEMVEGLLKEADLVTTTTDYLKGNLLKFNKNVWVCPNAISFNQFKERARQKSKLKIGWSGSITHYDDLLIIIDVIKDLQDKYDFDFQIQGLSSCPLISQVYEYGFYKKQGWMPEYNTFFEKGLQFYEKLKSFKNFRHIPFYVPELHPKVLSDLDWDIGLAPLADNKFNRSKSCIKFYEYCGVGTVTLASDVIPYNQEVNYLAKNTYKDWYRKLEKLIVDEKFRNQILDEQKKYVFQNRNIIKVVEDSWEKAYKSLYED